jgi:hypothetical protein
MLVTARIFSKSEAKNEGQGKTQISCGLNSADMKNLTGAESVGENLICLPSRSSDDTAGEANRIRPTDSQAGPSICPAEIVPEKAG